MQTVRWGVLSGSSFAAAHMAPAIHAAEGAELAAVATGSAEKAARLQAFCPGIRVVPDYESLLADPGIDAVYVPLPNALHVEWTRRALEAGKHVLTEKPVALRAEEIDALIELRDRTGLLASEAYMIVHHPQWQKVRALLAEGVIGDLRQVDAAFTFRLEDGGNIRNRPETGGGSLRDIGVYTLGAVLHATGADPGEVGCRIEWEGGIDATARGWAAFPGFGFSSLTSMRMAPREEVVFHGAEGVIRLPAPFTADRKGMAEVRLERGDEITCWRWPAARQYVLQVEAFGRRVREGADWPWPLEQAKRVQTLMDRFYAAAGAPN